MHIFMSHILWNRLPLSIREISSTKKFRNDLNKFLWNSEIGPLYKSLLRDNNNNEIDFVMEHSSSDSE